MLPLWLHFFTNSFKSILRLCGGNQTQSPGTLTAFFMQQLGDFRAQWSCCFKTKEQTQMRLNSEEKVHVLWVVSSPGLALAGWKERC